MTVRELNIKAIENNEGISVKMEGYTSDGVLIALLRDITEQLYQRKCNNIFQITKE